MYFCIYIIYVQHLQLQHPTLMFPLMFRLITLAALLTDLVISKSTGSCTSGSECDSGSCKGQDADAEGGVGPKFCCTTKGVSEGCNNCHVDDGDCLACDANYYLNNWQCYKCPGGGTSEKYSKSVSDCVGGSAKETGSCTSNSDCTSDSCKGNECCTTKGLTAGCNNCHDDGDCYACDANYYKKDYIFVV